MSTCERAENLKKMQLPATVDQLTPSWFSNMLKGAQIKSETFKLVSNIQEGVGFMSMMVRVEFEIEVPKNSPEHRSKYNLIVKLLPQRISPNGNESSFIAETRRIVVDTKFDQIEIRAYQNLLPDLIKEIPELKKFICPFHFGDFSEADSTTNTPHVSILILEDLGVLGYTTKLYGETIERVEHNQGIEFLATFNVACKSLEVHKGAKVPDIYPWFPNWLNDLDPVRSGQIPNILHYVNLGYEPLFKFLEDHGKAEFIPTYKLLASKTTQMMQALLIASHDHPCIVHMDLYSHNILVNKDPAEPVKVIDWQLIGYADPIVDLAYFVFTTVSPEDLNRSGVCRSLKSYFNKYSELCLQNGLPLDRSYDELEKFYLTFGFGFALSWFIMGFTAFLNIEGAEVKYLRSLEFFDEIGTPEFLLSII